MKSKLSRLGILSFAKKTENSVTENNHNPLKGIQRVIRRIVIIGGICMFVVALIAVAGVSVAWYGLRQEVRENQELVQSLCRQNNEQNTDILITALNLGVPFYRVRAFEPVDCSIKAIERRNDQQTEHITTIR